MRILSLSCVSVRISYTSVHVLGSASMIRACGIAPASTCKSSVWRKGKREKANAHVQCRSLIVAATCGLSIIDANVQLRTKEERRRFFLHSSNGIDIASILKEKVTRILIFILKRKALRLLQLMKSESDRKFVTRNS